jgi:two-component sensor histidine kinase
MADLHTLPVAKVRPLDLVIESNHRIANNLSALAALLAKRIAATRTGPESVPREDMVEALTEMAGQILSVARLHRILTAQPAQAAVDLNKVLTEFLQELKAAGIVGNRLHVASTLEPGCMVGGSRALLLSFVLSEIVTNAMRYAHPTGLPVELSITGAPTADGGVALQIADDGVGLPEGFVEERDAGVGLKLVRSLVEKAGGDLELKSDALGLIFSIQLPPQSRGVA